VGPGGHSIINYGPTNREGKTPSGKGYTKYSIDGEIAISKHARTELGKFERSLSIEPFDLGIDDPLLDEYYVIRLRLHSVGTAIDQPLTFAIFTGANDNKILSVQHKVIRPRNKSVKIVHSIPEVRWAWPEGGVKTKFTWDYPATLEEVYFNVYRSLLRKGGYGRANPKHITSTSWEMVEKARRELYPAYYKIFAANGWAQAGSEPFESQNLAPLRSFVRREPSQKDPAGASRPPTANSVNESELGFAQGHVNITLNNGMDANADLYVYVLCKVLPGSELAPSVALEGSPTVGFKLRGKVPPIRIPSIEFKADKLRARLTPIFVDYIASSESIILVWEKPEAREFVGVRVFRTPERQLGDLQGVTREQEVYDGPGLKRSVILRLAKTEALFMSDASKMEGILRFSLPPEREKPVASDGRPKLTPPSGLRFSSEVSLDSGYYIDTPPKGVTFTYVIYGYDENGNVSYPVLVNASLAEPGEGVEEIVTNK
jgi:hypothetical protein